MLSPLKRLCLDTNIYIIGTQNPSEDIEIFLSAKLGKVDCFVSSNRKLIQAIAEFECLTPVDFVNKYL